MFGREKKGKNGGKVGGRGGRAPIVSGPYVKHIFRQSMIVQHARTKYHHRL